MTCPSPSLRGSTRSKVLPSSSAPQPQQQNPPWQQRHGLWPDPRRTGVLSGWSPHWVALAISLGDHSLLFFSQPFRYHLFRCPCVLQPEEQNHQELEEGLGRRPLVPSHPATIQPGPAPPTGSTKGMPKTS